MEEPSQCAENSLWGIGEIIEKERERGGASVGTQITALLPTL